MRHASVVKPTPHRLGKLFEILAEKDEASYRRILDRHEVAPAEFLMVGNSPRSDIAPVTALGAAAVLVPYPLTWQHEQLEGGLGEYRVLESITELPVLLQKLRSK